MPHLALPKWSARGGRLILILLNIALVFFSSTSLAGDAANYAYDFYTSLLSPGGMNMPGGLHLLAQKGVHFTLFAALGVFLYNSLSGSTRSRLTFVTVFCLTVGAASEALQFLFPGRTPALHDVLLNGGSGLVAALFIRWSRSLLRGTEPATSG